MANLGKFTFPLRSVQPGLIFMHCFLVGTGESAPTIVDGRGFICTRNDVGDYTLTISGKGTLSIVGVFSTLMVSGVSECKVDAGSFNNSERTISILVSEQAVPPIANVPIDLISDDQVSLLIILRGSGV